MRKDAIRSHRLNYLLRVYIQNPHEYNLYMRAKLMGVSDATARNYTKSVIRQAKSLKI